MQTERALKNICLIVGSSGIGKAVARQLITSQRVYATYNLNSKGNDANTNLRFHYCNVLDDVIDLNYLPEQLHDWCIVPVP